MEAFRNWRMQLPENQRTLAQAGKLLGVSGSTISRYEAGLRRVPPERVIAVERITGIPRFVLRPDVFSPEDKVA